MRSRKALGTAAMIMVLAAAAGCGSAETDTPETGSTVSESTSAQEAAEKTRVPFEEVTVVENDLCGIKITALEGDEEQGYTLTAELSNSSEDRLYMYEVQSASINSVNIDPGFAMEIPAGISFPGTITFSGELLEEYGIGDVTDIELTFAVYDSDDDSGEYIANETIHIYPYGEENAEVFRRESRESDVVLSESDRMKVVCIAAETGEEGAEISLYLENYTEDSMMLYIENASLNGTEADPYWAYLLPAGKSGFSEVLWDADDLESFGIEDLSEITEAEFTMIAYAGGDFSAEAALEETFSISFEQ